MLRARYKEMVLKLPREKDNKWVVDLYQKVDAYNLVPNLESCLACGKCVGVCPVAKISPSYNSRQIIRDVLIGNMDRWLPSEEIWQCFWCANCYTLCPMDINFPLLMMQLRFRAIEQRFGLKYIALFKSFALRAREDGLTFVPGSEKRRDRIMQLRKAMGISPWPEISEKAKSEYKALFDITGTTAWLENIKEETEVPVRFTYMEGKIIREQREGN